MFFRIDHPDYQTDREQSKRNPIEYLENDYAIPGIDCPLCDTWGTAPPWRVRARVPENSEVERLLCKTSCWLSPKEWKDTTKIIASKLGVDYSQIFPGAEVGELKVTLISQPKEDFIFSWYGGVILVNDRVRDKLLGINATGVRFNKVALQWAKNIDKLAPLPSLWELEVTGRAIIRQEWLKKITSFCSICGRLENLDYRQLSPDMLEWHGSDFFTLDLNLAIVYVTDRICHALQEMQATNFRCYPFSLY